MKTVLQEPLEFIHRYSFVHLVVQTEKPSSLYLVDDEPNKSFKEILIFVGLILRPLFSRMSLRHVWWCETLLAVCVCIPKCTLNTDHYLKQVAKSKRPYSSIIRLVALYSHKTMPDHVAPSVQGFLAEQILHFFVLRWPHMSLAEMLWYMVTYLLIQCISLPITISKLMGLERSRMADNAWGVQFKNETNLMPGCV